MSMQYNVKSHIVNHDCFFCKTNFDIRVEYKEGVRYSGLYDVRTVHEDNAINVVFVGENLIEADAICPNCNNCNRIKVEI